MIGQPGLFGDNYGFSALSFMVNGFECVSRIVDLHSPFDAALGAIYVL